MDLFILRNDMKLLSLILRELKYILYFMLVIAILADSIWLDKKICRQNGHLTKVGVVSVKG